MDRKIKHFFSFNGGFLAKLKIYIASFVVKAHMDSFKNVIELLGK